ncbi:hypothetical protein BJX70DRAFT_270310 [Aspergillus crustosus]
MPPPTSRLTLELKSCRMMQMWARSRSKIFGLELKTISAFAFLMSLTNAIGAWFAHTVAYAAKHGGVAERRFNRSLALGLDIFQSATAIVSRLKPQAMGSSWRDHACRKIVSSPFDRIGSRYMMKCRWSI